MENHQNGQVITDGCENWWPIIFLVPNDIDLNDVDRLMRLVVATYCPALAWSNSRPWTAIVSNIYWLREDMVLALWWNINSIPVVDPRGEDDLIMVQQDGRWVIAHRLRDGGVFEHDKDDESVASGTTTTASSDRSTSSTTSSIVLSNPGSSSSSWVPVSSAGSSSWVQLSEAMDTDGCSTVALSEASWVNAVGPITRRRNRWTRPRD